MLSKLSTPTGQIIKKRSGRGNGRVCMALYDTMFLSRLYGGVWRIILGCRDTRDKMKSLGWQIRLFKRIIVYWYRTNKFILIMPVFNFAAAGLNVYVCYTVSGWTQWFHLGIALALITQIAYFQRKYFYTVYRVIARRCVADLATLAFTIKEIQDGKEMCPICYCDHLAIPFSAWATSVLRNPNLGKAPVNKDDIDLTKDLACLFCGYRVGDEII